jgi:integrase
MAKRTTGLLTEKFVREALRPESGEEIHRDGVVPGFVLRVGKRTKSFALRIERGRRGKPINIRLGEWPHLKADQAREMAEAHRAEYKAGLIIGSPSRAVTIDSAWAVFKDAPRRNGYDKSPATVDGYRVAYERLAPHIRAMPLRELTNNPKIMVDEIKRITKERSNGLVGGVAAGNATIRFVRAVYRYAALMIDESLPAKHPCRTLVIRKTKRKDGRDQKVLTPPEMPVWNRQRLAIANEVRREYHLFALLSGLRRNDLETLEWANVNWPERKVRIPDPKGGEEEGGFDLILTRPMIACLIRAKRAGEKLYPLHAARWVFPGEGDDGRMAQATKDDISYSNHALRRGYSSVARGAGVPDSTIDMFLDHRPKSVAGLHYIKASALGRYLAAQQATISRAIVAGLG